MTTTTLRSSKPLFIFLIIYLFIPKIRSSTSVNNNSEVTEALNSKVIVDKVKDSEKSDLNLQQLASERVEKILDLPVTLNFDDEPVTKSSLGFYGGHRRNIDLTPEEEKLDDGNFGAKIILGIVEHVPALTSTLKPVVDQRNSQTIVKFFDKEDYNGIKTEPIIVEDTDERTSTDIETTAKPRIPKDIEDLEQESPTEVKDLTGDEESTDYKEEIEEDYKPEQLEENSEIKEDPRRKYEDDGSSDIKATELPRYILKESKRHKYEEYNIPDNHKEEPDEDEKHKEDQEDPDESQYNREQQEPTRYNQDSIVDIRPSNREKNEQLTEEKEQRNHDDSHEKGSVKYITYDDEKEAHKPDNNDHVVKSSNVAEDATKDQKGSADQTHEDVKHKKKNVKHSSGKGDEHHSEHHGHKGDKGVKNYKGYHEETKSKKGHHDKEKHGKKYADEGGSDKKHHEEQEHHGEHHKGEKGEKSSDFSEEGKHSKGHSTKGEHNIHKKDEYEKNQEFYDEHHEGGEHEKHGGFHFDHHYEKGGHKKGGHKKGGDHKEHYGKKSEHESGHHYDDKKGHKKAAGHNEHHSHHTKHGKKDGHSGKKHWSYEKGKGGGGGHKKYTAGPQAAHSVLLPEFVHGHHKEDGEKYPHYVARIHVKSGNRRSDHYENDANNVTENEPHAEDFLNDKENHREKISDKEAEEIEATTNGEEVKTKLRRLDQETFDQEENEELSSLEDNDGDSVETQQLPSITSSNSEVGNITDNVNLPKIYLLIPKDYEERLQKSQQNSIKEQTLSEEHLGYPNKENFNRDIASIENESSYEDYDESLPNTRIETTQMEKMKIIEPLRQQSFPEEHRRRLSEITHMVHKIGNKVDEERSSNDAKKRSIKDNKPRKFSINRSIENY